MSIYIHSPSDGPMRNEATQPRYAYPGREVSYEDGKTVLYKARAFLGDCLPGYRNAVVWYEGVRTEGGGWASGVSPPYATTTSRMSGWRNPSPPSRTLFGALG